MQRGYYTFNRHYHRMWIAFFWIIGFLVGVLLFLFTCSFLNTSKSKCIISEPSVFGLFFSSVIPVIFTTVFASRKNNILLAATIAIKAIFHGLAMAAVGSIWQGNPDRSQFLFSQSCCGMLMLITCFYWHNIPKTYQNLFHGSVILSSVILLLIDYYWII